MSELTPSKFYIDELEQFAKTLSNYEMVDGQSRAAIFFTMKAVAQHLFRIARDRKKIDGNIKRYKQALEKIANSNLTTTDHRASMYVSQLRNIAKEALKESE